MLKERNGYLIKQARQFLINLQRTAEEFQNNCVKNSSHKNI